jgi:chemotaxis methyl-accepting protein methylase/mannose-6-phosphate isomerase-like protein (cupin superfamily)
MPMPESAMAYVYSLPTSASFTGKGLLGYTFGPLSQQDLEVYYIEVETGHDTFMVSRKIARIYYVLSGNGHFTLDDQKYNVNPGMLIEVPPGVEYSYSGKMKLLAFSKPRWFAGNDTHIKWNSDVVGPEFPRIAHQRSWLTGFVRLTVFGRSPVNFYLRLNQRLWNKLPKQFAALSPVRFYAEFLHKLARTQGVRAQAFSTYFLRNRPQLELMRRLLKRSARGSTFRVAVLGCSTGSEAYSVAWRIRSARPDLKLTVTAVDISRQAIEAAQRGIYSLVAAELTNTNVFERMTPGEIEDMFDKDGDVVTVKPWIKECINWYVGDVGGADIPDRLGAQEIVIANNFLCHLDPIIAEQCLRNIARLVLPYGHLFVSGVDLEVRTKVANDLGWHPVEELLEEIHEGDPCMASYWPCHYGGLEPLNKKRRDWRLRYAAAFQLVPKGEDGEISAK